MCIFLSAPTAFATARVHLSSIVVSHGSKAGRARAPSPSTGGSASPFRSTSGEAWRSKISKSFLSYVCATTHASRCAGEHLNDNAPGK